MELFFLFFFIFFTFHQCAIKVLDSKFSQRLGELGTPPPQHEKKVGDKNGGSCSLFGLGPKRRKTRENNLTDPLWIHFDSLRLISLCQSIKTQQAIYSPNVFD